MRYGFSVAGGSPTEGADSGKKEGLNHAVFVYAVATATRAASEMGDKMLQKDSDRRCSGRRCPGWLPHPSC